MENKNKNGFTLIELLIVIAIVGIVASVALVSLNSGREKAKEKKFIAYVSQVSSLVDKAIAAGEFDNISANENGCLGNYPSDQCFHSPSYNKKPANINALLSKVGEIPDGEYNPFYPSQIYGTAILHLELLGVKRVYILINTETDHSDICDNVGWKNVVYPTATSPFCYTVITL